MHVCQGREPAGQPEIAALPEGPERGSGSEISKAFRLCEAGRACVAGCRSKAAARALASLAAMRSPLGWRERIERRMNCLFKPRGVGKSELLNWLAVLISAPPQPPNPPSPQKGEGGLTISRFLTLFYLVQDFGFIFVVFTQKCIVDDICDAGARFFTFPRRGPQTKGLVKSA